jgi:protein-disulfide isomerase
MVKAQAAKRDVEVDQELSEDLEVTVSPQLFVNGRRLIGEQSYERVSSMVEEEIKKAEAILRSGIEPQALYEWFIKDGQPAEPLKKTIPFGPNSPWKGAAQGPVVIQAFSDFQCAQCRRVDAYLEEVAK